MDYGEGMKREGCEIREPCRKHETGLQSWVRKSRFSVEIAILHANLCVLDFRLKDRTCMRIVIVQP